MRISAIVLLFCALLPIGATRGAPPAPSPVTRLKTLYPHTVLVNEGVAKCMLVMPDGWAKAPRPAFQRSYRAAAARLLAAIRNSTGAEIEVADATQLVDDDWTVDFAALNESRPVPGLATNGTRSGHAVAGRNIVALGNVNNNRLLSVLYGQRYVVEDSIYPGAGGYTIRTVHDPFARGINVLVLAGSDPAGVEQAVNVFCDTFISRAGLRPPASLVLHQPVILAKFEKKAYRFFPEPTDSLSSKRQPQYTGLDWFATQLRNEGLAAGPMDASGKTLRNTQPGKTLLTLTSQIARIGQTYFRTGNPQLPPLLKQLLDSNRHLLSIPESPNEMGARAAWHVPEWDLLEELPVWTDQDRLDITNALLRDAALGHERRAFHNQVQDGALMAMDENHGTFSAMNSFVAWQYFHKYYPSAASDYWMRCARAVFSAQASTFQIPEDAAGYLCYCPATSMNYALRAGDLSYFKRGIARHHAQYIAAACINNLGFSTGFGDEGSLVSPEFFEALAPAAWFHRDPKLSWILRNKLPPACGLRIFQNAIAFDLDLVPSEPTDWTGLIRIPLYEAPLQKGDSSTTPVFAEKKDVSPRFFNKIVFRENWSDQGQYLLLDGAGCWGRLPGPHGHKHDDINTLINLTSHGRMWLVDHTYQQRAFKDHSGVLVLCDGVGGFAKQELAELLDFVDSKDFALTRTRFMNWERAIFWRKGRYFLILDTVTATKPGDYFARCSFRALGNVQVRADGFRLSQQDKHFQVVTDSTAALSVEEYAFTDSQWKTFYPYAEPKARILQQDKARPLKPGETISFVNLLAASNSPEGLERIRLAHTSENCAIVLDEGQETLVGVGRIPGDLGTANMFALSANVALLPGAEEKTLRLPNLAARSLAAARQHRRQADAQAGGSFALPGIHEVPTRQVRLSNETPPANNSRPAAIALTAFRLADLDNDKACEWLVGADDGVHAYRSDGRRLWHFPTKQPVRCLDAADLNGDGLPEIAIGAMDEQVHLLDANGKHQWSFRCAKSEDSISLPPVVDYVKIADLDRTGRPGAKKNVVAGANWLHVLNADGTVKWEKYMALRRGRVSGDFVAGDVSDLNGDGRPEITALYMTSYPLAVVYDALGNLIMPGDGPGDHGGLNIDTPCSVLTIPLFGAGHGKHILCRCANQIRFLNHDQKRQEQAGGTLSGSFIAMDALITDPTRSPILVAADDTCGVVGISVAPGRADRSIAASIAWYKNVGERITTLMAAQPGNGHARVYVGTRRGNVYILNARHPSGGTASGSVEGVAVSGSAGIAALAFDKSMDSVLAATADGVIVSIRP